MQSTLSRLTPPLLGFLAGALVGLMVSRSSVNSGAIDLDASRSAAPRPAAQATDEAALNDVLLRLDTRLASLEQKLGALESAPTPARTVAVTDETSTTARLDEVLQRLQTIEARVTEQERQGEQLVAEMTGLGTLKEEHPEINWDALRALIDRWRLDENAAHREVQLWSDKDLVRRFGSPTIVWSNEKGLHWFYRDGHDPVSNTYATEVYFRLQNGYVTTLGVALN